MSILTLAESVSAHAHRKLISLANYYQPNADPCEALSVVPLTAAERAIGIYVNDASRRDYVVITNAGLHLSEGTAVRFVAYQDMAQIHVESDGGLTKHTANEITVRLSSGETVPISIRGGQGRFNDIWPFYTFLLPIVKRFQIVQFDNTMKA